MKIQKDHIKWFMRPCNVPVKSGPVSSAKGDE